MRDARNPGRSGRVVRIVQKRSTPRAAKISLLIAAGVAVTVFFAFRIWQSDDVPDAFQRSLVDIVLDWRCEDGHFFQLQGQLGPVTCPECGRLADPIATYVCTEHGPVEIAGHFATAPDGTFYLSKVRYRGGDWLPPETTLTCPKCNRELRRSARDPLAALKR